MLPRDLNPLPEAPPRLHDIEDQRQELQDADDDGDEDGDGCEHDGVVQHGDGVVCGGGGGVERHHEGAVEGVEEAHSDCISRFVGFLGMRDWIWIWGMERRGGGGFTGEENREN